VTAQEARRDVPVMPEPVGLAAPPAAPGEQPRPQVSSARLVLTLAVAGALAGGLLMGAYQATLPAITANKQAALERAVQEVLQQPARWEPLFLVDGRVVAEVPAGQDARSPERVYLGFDDAGAPVGFAVSAAQPGFQDVIRLIYGYDPRSGRLLGMKVLESKETPGLGDKIEKDLRFVGQFAGKAPPLLGVKPGEAGEDPAKVDMITGATISSRAVVRILNDSLARVGPALRAYSPAEAPR